MEQHSLASGRDIFSTAPSEVLDHVASYLSEPSDLLHFALVSSTFRDVVIPNHLNYCNILTDIYNEDLWNELTPRRGARVAELSLSSVTAGSWLQSHDERDETLIEPGWIANAIFKDSDRFLKTRRIYSGDIDPDLFCFDGSNVRCSPWVVKVSGAISTMPCLRKLVVHLNLYDASRISQRGFFQSIARGVEDLEIRLFRNAEPYDFDIVDPVRKGLESLKADCVRFSFHSDLSAGVTERILSSIPTFLHKCDNLKALEIYAGLKDPFGVCKCEGLWQGSWLRLESLTLHAVVSDLPQGNQFSRFLDHHHRLKEFRITAWTQPFILDLYSRLPYLRVLEVDHTTLCLVEQLLDLCDDSLERPFESLVIRARDPSIDTLACAVNMICRHGSAAATLQSLTWDVKTSMRPQEFWLRIIGQCTPTITELITNPWHVTHDEYTWEKVLEWFPNLEVLGAPDNDYACSFPYPPGGSDDMTEYNLRKLEARYPKLRQVDRWLKESERVWRHCDTKHILRLQ